VSYLLEIQDLRKSFVIHQLGRHIGACSDVSLSIASGEFVGVTGRSGSGKSTVLKMIYRTYLPESGRVLYDSRAYGPIDLSRADERQVIYLRKHEIGYVSQFLHVIPRTTAREIIEQSVLETGQDRGYAAEQAQAMLGHFEMDRELWDTYPKTFSGGEKLRLNIARAMAKRPRLLLLDEPTASLDQYNKEKVRSLIRQLKRDGTTMLGIFHDIEFMAGLCDREYRMDTGRLNPSHTTS
jgi:alpha-D-ribose 1-methylphosphonate 5-triphosphate synthase subunit PhnL